MPLASDKAGRGPYTEHIAFVRCKLLDILNRPFLIPGIGGLPFGVDTDDICLIDKRKWVGVVSLGINPPNRGGYMQSSGAVKRSNYVIKIPTDSPDHFCQ